MQKRTSSFHRSLTLLAGGLLLGSAASAAHAQTVITSLPYTISSGGLYVLNNNLASSQSSGNLITVNASNVTLDFQDHFISGTASTVQPVIGVYANEKSNLTVKNGTVAYCAIGVYITGDGTTSTNSVDHQVDNMRLTYCSYVGAYVSFSPATRITNCQVSQGGYNNASTAYGILASGAGITIEQNVVSTITATTPYGIYMNTGNFSRQNVVSNATTGIYGGKYQDNLTSNCATPFTGGNDAGGNN